MHWKHPTQLTESIGETIHDPFETDVEAGKTQRKHPFCAVIENSKNTGPSQPKPCWHPKKNSFSSAPPPPHPTHPNSPSWNVKLTYRNLGRPFCSFICELQNHLKAETGTFQGKDVFGRFRMQWSKRQAFNVLASKVAIASLDVHFSTFFSKCFAFLDLRFIVCFV